MSASQREARRRVIKGRVEPTRCGVALLAGGGKSGLYVVRAGGAIKVFYVARRAVGRRPYELPVDMALCARHIHVRTGQGKLRKCAVIKGRRVPGSRAVTGLASLGEAGLPVRRVAGLIEIVQVTTDTCCRSSGVLPAEMACHAVESRMGSSQCEACKLEVIELCPQPVIHAMALSAVGWELKLRVIRLRALEFIRMAAVAVGGHGGVVTQRTIFMTGVALDGGMRP